MAGSKNLFYILEVTADHCVAEFYINDFPIVRRGGACGYYYGGPVNEYLIKGLNTLSVIIEPGDRPGSAMAGDNGGRRRAVPEKEAAVSMKLSRYPKGAIVGGPDGEALIASAWQADEGRPMMLPQVRSVQVELDPPFGPWPWERYNLLQYAVYENHLTNLDLLSLF